MLARCAPASSRSPAWAGSSPRAPFAPLVACAVAPLVACGHGAGAGDAGDAAPRPADGPPLAPDTPFTTWLRARVPSGARVVVDDGAIRVLHAVVAGDTFASIARLYADVTDVYAIADLASEIEKSAGPLSPGGRIAIPRVLAAPYEEARPGGLGWPEDGALRGIFLTGAYARSFWVPSLDKVAARKMNAVVLDAKDYEGPVNYPTKAKIAVEIGATPKDPPVPDLARAIRFAHARGVRVILRIPCFHDPLAAAKAPRLAVPSARGGALKIGWLDPTNEEAQGYVLELVQEAIDAGADEVQLDYVRFPVDGPVNEMKLPPPSKGQRIRVIRDLVRRAHALTSKANAALSLDVFGVAATGERSDWEALGQDISVLGRECEALSPMVYPSHYDRGYRGYAEPGAHPEIVGIGTRAAVAHLPRAKGRAVIRSWLQAFKWRAPNYGPKYLVEEARQAEANGGVGWLMWSPSNDYSAAWAGFPPIARR